MTRLAKAMSAFTHGRSASVAAGRDARSFATRGASRDGEGSGASSHGRPRLVVLALSLAALAVALGAGIASGATKGQITAFGSAGFGSGQFGVGTLTSTVGPAAVAVNQTGVGGVGVGDVYVVDTANNRVERFTADGDFIAAFGSAGTGGGQFNAPQGVAVDPGTGVVYVTDRENRRLQKFTAQGNFLRTWGWGVLNGAAAFQVCNSTQTCQAGTGATGTSAAGGQMATGTASPRVVVDPDNGNVYVSDPGNRRIQEFDSSGNFLRLWGWDVVTAGKVAAGDLGTNNFEICTSTVALDCKGANTSAGTDNGRFGSNSPSTMAIDANGVLYASDAGSGAAANRVQRFDTDNSTPATLLNFLPAGNGAIGQAAPATAASPLMTGATTGLAIDTVTGDLLVARDPTAAVVAGLNIPANPSAETWIQEIANPGTELAPQPAPNPAVVDNHAQGEAWIGDTIAASSRGVLADIATRGSSGRIYASRPAVSQVAVLNQPGTQASATAPTITANTTGVSATFNGSVNPNGSLTAYRFQYRACPGGVCGSGAFTSVPAAETSVGSSKGNIAVSQAVTGLTPNTTYEVQLVADGFGAPAVTTLTSFLTPAAPPAISNRPAALVTDTTAQLQGAITPNNAATTYYFQYLSDAAFKANGGSYVGPSAPVQVPLVPASLPAGMSSVVVFQEATGLTPQTTYHFRVVANNGIGGDQFGADQKFTTRATPAPQGSLARGLELVSPADKAGGTGVGEYDVGDTGSVIGLASGDGNRYIAQGRHGSVLMPEGAMIYADDFAFAERTPNGWLSHSPFTHPDAEAPKNTQVNILAWSSDLSRTSMSSSAAPQRLFPEQATWSPNKSIVWVNDWEGRWEAFNTDESQGDPGNGASKVFSADGSHFLVNPIPNSPGFRGLLGTEDPSLDQISGPRVVYAVDLSAGISDTFPGTGVRTLINVCTGAGSARTQIPSRDTAGKLGAQDCPPAPPNRSESLISTRGAAIGRIGSPSPHAVSNDGTRVFFMSPDPQGLPSAYSPPASCSGVDLGTLCPPQVYVREQRPDGSFATRWISRSTVPNQDASLMGTGIGEGSSSANWANGSIFQGASVDGDRVFFATNSPLTTDDPNGGTQVAGGVRAGTANPSSWDLYRFDFTDTDGDDPGTGSLTRVSAGPTGAGDCDVPGPNDGSEASVTSLRFNSDDGERVYFTCTGVLPGVPAPSNGTVTTPTNAADNVNLYLYDGSRPFAQRWEFVAALPTNGRLSGCASRGALTGETLYNLWRGGNGMNRLQVLPGMNCVRGTADGNFVTLFTDAQLTSDDSATASGDIYAFDAEADVLRRISAAQGGAGGSYSCVTDLPVASCNGDPGFGQSSPVSTQQLLGVATHPATAGDRLAFFQSKSQLVAEDTDTQMDVYQWRNGELSLLSTGVATTGAYYAGNGVSGRDVFFETRAPLTWQDFDAVMDVYDARVGGGIPEPPAPPPSCDILAGGCQGAATPAPAPAPASSTVLSGQGNVVEGKRKKGKTQKKKSKGKRGARVHRAAGKAGGAGR